MKTTTSSAPPSTTTNPTCSYIPDDYCKNGGACVDVKSGQVVCQCATGFTGSECELVVGATRMFIIYSIDFIKQFLF